MDTLTRLRREASWQLRLSSSGTIIYSAAGNIIERVAKEQGRKRLIQLRYEYIEKRQAELCNSKAQ